MSSRESARGGPLGGGAVEGAGLEALVALRDATRKGVRVPEDPDPPQAMEAGKEGRAACFEIEGRRFPKGTTTPFKADSGDYMSLAQLVLFLAYTKDGKTEIKDYMRAARSKDVPQVKFKDRKEVLDFLTGRAEWSSRIDAKPPSQAAVSDQTAQDTGGAAADAGKARFDAENVAEEKTKELRKQVSSDSRKQSTRPKRAGSDISPEEALVRRIRKREGSHYDRNTVLLSSHRFTEALRLDRETKRQKTLELQKGILKTAGEDVTKKPRLGCPILIVPASNNAPINLYNVKQFLENGRYESPATIRSKSPEKPQHVIVEKQIGDHGICRFKVVDSVKRFRDEDWGRVAAVFTLGPTWQFKDWRKWNSDPAIIFANCSGIHVYFDDVKLAPHLMTWNILICPLKKQTRSQDGIEQHRIWVRIQQFLQTKKMTILQSGLVRHK